MYSLEWSLCDELGSLPEIASNDSRLFRSVALDLDVEYDLKVSGLPILWCILHRCAKHLGAGEELACSFCAEIGCTTKSNNRFSRVGTFESSYHCIIFRCGPVGRNLDYPSTAGFGSIHKSIGRFADENVAETAEETARPRIGKGPNEDYRRV